MTSIVEPVRFTYPSRDGLIIAAYRWQPTAVPRGIVQLTHGMGEHLLRYSDLGRALSAEGFVVVGQDHRGHGVTAMSPPSSATSVHRVEASS